MIKSVIAYLYKGLLMYVFSGCGLDNIMIPLKTTAGKNVLPSVQGKHVQVVPNII